ncbi:MULTISPECIES: GAF and ANTAR domain-containing protein [Paeniglutamicibacter]|uniref:GAF domain-containing protein n=1 Tax=Paeniglutamicibacter sulfureus TaxID=43666 RepID=A0ABU2BI47_9MICC|nr:MULTISPECIES: GAF and ANTAR domain-containing protein [Paeniglutamicibacter]MCV9995204.1 GAF and ANTAR domain-containing protein [Paeniglutamicibacter sp. ZC-3]MDO2933872.1 GAF and ANTAR domain-containing protein [Paeniglutamicibacter sulfureus]MDR7358313.1 GAF domain-containing protein [Paeniglutamicibacter sulfureus]
MARIGKSLPIADELAAAAAGAAGLLMSEATVAETLKLITAAAKSSVPFAIGAGVTLMDANARPTSAAASDEVVEQADSLQYDLEQGPCLSAWATGETVVVQDIAADDRWPEWSRLVAPLAVAASISVPLKSSSESFGAVKVYAAEPQAFTERSRGVLELLARQASVLLEHAITAEQAKKVSDELRSTLYLRDVIGMAKGIIMERHGVAADDAVRLLLKQAIAEGRTLGEFAARLVEAATPQGA